MSRVLRCSIPILLLFTPAVLQAQEGCIHSPECPTALLGMLGAAGAALYTRWRAR